MCDTGSVCVPRWHSRTRLISSVSSGDVIPKNTKNKWHSSTGLRCFFITLEASKRGFYLVAKQLVYPDCSELHGVSKRLQGQLRPVCGFAAPL